MKQSLFFLHSNETRTGKGEKWENLWLAIKTNHTIFSQKKPAPTLK